MAIVPESNAILVVGGNGKLVLMSQKDGKVLSSADVASRIDQLAYDPGLHRAYGASGAGKISVVQVDGEKLTSLGDVSSADGAHSVAVDPKTHTVWIAYAKGDSSFVQPFAAK
jgi:DNA-binding beta-propeller fold protein YncE